ncbi:hypothetical protein, partial [Dactylosporangium salmoneum]|uniref:hypothetical protein n=1 Tax=Dactylosporangium salmoneum TaxID=53361 RepID=UPI0031D4DE14
RRLAAVGGAELAVAAVLAAAGLGLPGRSAPPPAASGTPAVSPTGISVPAPPRFDPLVQYADFGWVPDGLTSRGVYTEPVRQRVSAAAPVTAKEQPGRVSLVTVPPGGEISPDVTYTDADPVGGRPARWGQEGGTTVLRWQYAPGSWAEVTVADLADPRAVARRVAESVRFGVDRPIRMPIRASGIPPAFRLMGASVYSYGSGVWSAELDFSDAGGVNDLGDWPLRVMAVTTAQIGNDNGATLGEPNTTVDGHPARRTTGSDGGKGLQVYDVDGVYLELATHGPTVAGKLPGGLDAVLRNLEVAHDPAGWF